jgi:two-component system, chemotaxis family, protein-glutamate methylesterase/glutaminase
MRDIRTSARHDAPAESRAGAEQPYPLRRFAALTPRVIAIGASTGGPQALSALLARVAPRLGATPVVVVLHMPRDFTPVVANDIARLTGLPTSSPQNGERLEPGHIYFAPGDIHMKVVRIGQTHALAYSDAPPENFCKPAVDVLFRSVADAFGPGALGIVLTGMGADGLAGSKRIVEAGGSVVVQDEASSVVWGMPGEVARAGLASAIAPIGGLADVVCDRLSGSRRSVR